MLQRSSVAARVPATDLERANAFYADKLGGVAPSEERPGGLRYLCGTSEFVLFQSSGAASGEHTHMSWEVDDLEAKLAEQRSRSVAFEDRVPSLRGTRLPYRTVTTGIHTSIK